MSDKDVDAVEQEFGPMGDTRLAKIEKAMATPCESKGGVAIGWVGPYVLWVTADDIRALVARVRAAESEVQDLRDNCYTEDL